METVMDAMPDVTADFPQIVSDSGFYLADMESASYDETDLTEVILTLENVNAHFETLETYAACLIATLGLLLGVVLGVAVSGRLASLWRA